MSAKVYVGPGRIYEFFQKCRAGLERAPAILAEETDRSVTIRLSAGQNSAIMRVELNDGDDIHFYPIECRAIEETEDATDFMAEISDTYEEFLEGYILREEDAPAGSNSSYAEDDIPGFDDDPSIEDRQDELYYAALDFLDVLVKHGVKDGHKSITDAAEIMSEDEILAFVLECAESLAGGFHVSCYVPTILTNDDGTIECVAYPFEM